jgi:hypothetical protein
MEKSFPLKFFIISRKNFYVANYVFLVFEEENLNKIILFKKDKFVKRKIINYSKSQ